MKDKSKGYGGPLNPWRIISQARLEKKRNDTANYSKLLFSFSLWVSLSGRQWPGGFEFSVGSYRIVSPTIFVSWHAEVCVRCTMLKYKCTVLMCMCTVCDVLKQCVAVSNFPQYFQNNNEKWGRCSKGPSWYMSLKRFIFYLGHPT